VWRQAGGSQHQASAQMDRNIFASLCTGVRFDKQKAAAGAAAAKPQAQPEAVAEELPSAAEPASNDPLEVQAA